MIKHNICHIHSLNHPSVYKIIYNLHKHNHLFDGEKLAKVTKVSPELQVYTLVVSILEKLGYDVITVENNDKREVSHFFDISLPKLLSKTTEGILFYNHSKGVIYHPDSEDGKVTNLWTDVLYHYCLDQVDKLPFDNDKYKSFGTCKVSKKGFLPDKINENFTYVGTFFWIRLATLVGVEFKPHSKFYLEGLPGLVATSAEGFNIGPALLSSEGPYNLETWNKKGIHYGFPNQITVN